MLRVAGIPAAAEIWFRLGQVASVPSMVYDRRLAALGPGSMVVWRAQERAFAESPPCVLDHLPGNNPLKDQIATDRPPYSSRRSSHGWHRFTSRRTERS